MPELTRITRDPAVMGGKRGMRVTVGTVVGLVATGRTRDEILREYPSVPSCSIRLRTGGTQRAGGRPLGEVKAAAASVSVAIRSEATRRSVIWQTKLIVSWSKSTDRSPSWSSSTR